MWRAVPLIAGAIVARLLVLDTTPAAQSPIRVGPNVLVSHSQPEAVHWEVLLAAHPTDPNQLLGCAIVYNPARNRNSDAVYVSADSGVTWTKTLDTDSLDQTGDPACAIGVDGAAYHAGLSQSFAARLWGGIEAQHLTIPVFRSADNGQTWQRAQVLDTSSSVNDREWLIVDGSQGPNRGRLYMNSTIWVHGTDGSRERAVALYRSRDGGASFEAPTSLKGQRPGFVHLVSNPVILSDGTVAFTFTERKTGFGADGFVNPGAGERPTWLKATRSVDGGQSLEAPVTVTDIASFSGVIDTSIPALAVDSGSVLRDRLYTVWSDKRTVRSEVFIASSSDRGRSWSAPVAVEAESLSPPAGDQYLASVAVNKQGIVGVFWYDRRHDPEGLGYCPRFAASLDAGRTFLPSVQVAGKCATVGAGEQWPIWATGGQRGPAGAPLRINVRFYPRFYTGADTSGLAADAAGTFHAMWVDNRTGLPQVWTAPITVTGAVMPHGSPALSALQDVTAKVKIEVAATEYERRTKTAKLDLRIRNVSSDLLRAPLKLRVVGLESQLGVVRVLEPDGGPDRIGAELDFTATLDNGVLPPGGRTGPKRVAFEVANPRPFYSGGTTGLWTLVSPEFFAYARIDSPPSPAAK